MSFYVNYECVSNDSSLDRERSEPSASLLQTRRLEGRAMEGRSAEGGFARCSPPPGEWVE